MSADEKVPWAPELPTHWAVRKAWTLTRFHQRSVNDDDETVTAFRDGQVTLRKNRRLDGFTEALQEIGYQGVRDGDIVIHGMDGFAGAIGISDSNGKMSPVVHIHRPIDGLADSRFLVHAIREAAAKGYVQALAKGIRERSTSFDKGTFRHLRLPAPPFSDQRRIADFLDRETAQIDEFIAENEELIALLNERRAAVIARTVTKGLDPSAPMRDSGVEWLGEVPNHWATPKIRRYFRFQLGKMLNASTAQGELTPYVRAGNIQDYGIDLTDVALMAVTSEERAALHLETGDVLVVEGGAGYGRSAFLDQPLPGWVFQNHVIRVRPARAGDTDGRYLDYWLRFLRSQGHYEAISAYATIPNVSARKLGGIEMTLPPIEEQKKIAEHLDTQTARIDEAVATAREGIALAKERRAALISAAVTGKIDVGA